MPSVSILVLGTFGGGGPVTVTVFVTSSVDVTVTAALLFEPPQAVRTVATAAIAAFFHCIEGEYPLRAGHRRSERRHLPGAHHRLLATSADKLEPRDLDLQAAVDQLVPLVAAGRRADARELLTEVRACQNGSIATLLDDLIGARPRSCRSREVYSRASTVC